MSVSGSVTILAQDAVEPLVVKYLPLLPVWEGSASTVPQDAAEPLVVKYLPLFLVCAGSTYTLDVSSDTVTEPAVPPLLNPVPAVTEVISPEDVNTVHAVPLYAYIIPSPVL